MDWSKFIDKLRNKRTVYDYELIGKKGLGITDGHLKGVHHDVTSL